MKYPTTTHSPVAFYRYDAKVVYKHSSDLYTETIYLKKGCDPSATPDGEMTV